MCFDLGNIFYNNMRWERLFAKQMMILQFEPGILTDFYRPWRYLSGCRSSNYCTTRYSDIPQSTGCDACSEYLGFTSVSISSFACYFSQRASWLTLLSGHSVFTLKETEWAFCKHFRIASEQNDWCHALYI